MDLGTDDVGVIIEYDEGKNRKNVRKHGITFTEAEAAITDPLSIHLYDGAHSIEEDRWIAIGNSDGRILAVSFTMRGDVFRIISTRKATMKEENLYFQS